MADVSSREVRVLELFEQRHVLVTLKQPVHVSLDSVSGVNWYPAITVIAAENVTWMDAGKVAHITAGRVGRTDTLGNGIAWMDTIPNAALLQISMESSNIRAVVQL